MQFAFDSTLRIRPFFRISQGFWAVAIQSSEFGVQGSRFGLKLTSVHPEMDWHQQVPAQIGSRYRTRTKNSTAGIWLIFRGLNFSRNADIGQISHFWMGTN
jgi:hypothetical protein